VAVAAGGVQWWGTVAAVNSREPKMVGPRKVARSSDARLSIGTERREVQRS
jgi:hypothetical protein